VGAKRNSWKQQWHQQLLSGYQQQQQQQQRCQASCATMEGYNVTQVDTAEHWLVALKYG
jgi:hypothetical protein